MIGIWWIEKFCRINSTMNRLKCLLSCCARNSCINDMDGIRNHIPEKMVKIKTLLTAIGESHIKKSKVFLNR